MRRSDATSIASRWTTEPPITQSDLDTAIYQEMHRTAPIVAYNGGCEEFEDKMDYVAPIIRGTRL